jgi:hypothetical protein
LGGLGGGEEGEAGIPPHASAPGTAAVATARDDSFISVVFESLVEEFNVVRYVQEQEEIKKGDRHRHNIGFQLITVSCARLDSEMNAQPPPGDTGTDSRPQAPVVKWLPEERAGQPDPRILYQGPTWGEAEQWVARDQSSLVELPSMKTS